MWVLKNTNNGHYARAIREILILVSNKKISLVVSRKQIKRIKATSFIILIDHYKY